jgi:transcriptional regulator with XRE-family HTH domain
MTIQPDRLGQSKADLAATIKELRLKSGLSGDRLAQRCHMSQSKISKMETGKLTPSIVDVEQILQALDVPAEIAQEIRSLARIANTEWRGFKAAHRHGLESIQTELAALESRAREIRFFLPSMITALLATPEYVRASIAHAPGNTSKTVAKKLERQATLYDESKRFTFVLTEQAVTWTVVERQAMAVQIERLVAVSHIPSVEICVIPVGTQLTRGPLNTFTIYDEQLVTVETFTGRLVFQDPSDVAEHLELFSWYQNASLQGGAARALLSEWAARYRS